MHTWTLNSADFVLDPDGTSHIAFPFVEADWFVVTGSVCHDGDDKYADDWNWGTGDDDEGKLAMAAAPGHVIFAGRNAAGESFDGYGNQVVVQVVDENGDLTEFAYRYAHLQSIAVEVDDYVNFGSEIGTVGGTGENDDSFSPHLHSVLYKNIYETSGTIRSGIDNLKLGYSPSASIPCNNAEATIFAAPFVNDASPYYPNLADLKVSGISFTSPPTPGVRTTAIASLANVGRTSSDVFNVKWYLDSAQVGYGRHESLAPGQTSIGNVRFDWTPTAGAHTLRFETDVDAHVTESDETNNAAEVTINVQAVPLADLRVSGIRFSTAPTPGLRTTAIASLANVGQLDSGVFNVKWYLDGVQVGYGRHESLAPGQTSNGNVRFDWTPTAGAHTLRFETDVDNHVTELVETNNATEGTINVQAVPLADLKVSGISFTSPPTPGVRTTAIASLANVGRTSSDVFNVKWYLDSAQVGYGRHESLAPGQTSIGNVRFDWTPKRGTHTLRFEADVDAHVTESDETNNAAAITVGTSIR